VPHIRVFGRGYNCSSVVMRGPVEARGFSPAKHYCRRPERSCRRSEIRETTYAETRLCLPIRKSRYGITVTAKRISVCTVCPKKKSKLTRPPSAPRYV
jgi:hypothetical protein